MKTSTTLSPSLQALVQDFFEKHLTLERHASPNTIVSYRDGLKLFLRYAVQRAGCSVDRLDHAALDVEVVRSFLAWLEQQRQCGARTRNHRLATIKAFARYVAAVAPENLERCRRIRDLPPARFEHPEVKYLEDDEVLALVKATDPAEQGTPQSRALAATTLAPASKRSPTLRSAIFVSNRFPWSRSRAKDASSAPALCGQEPSALSRHGSRNAAVLTGRFSSTPRADASAVPASPTSCTSSQRALAFLHGIRSASRLTLSGIQQLCTFWKPGSISPRSPRG